MPRICALTICVMLWNSIAWGQQTPATVAPAVVVKMIDLVDSSHDPAGKQYRAGLIRSVNIGNGTIVVQGSAATVVLVRDGSGWAVQLSSLVIKDQVTTVTSNSGNVIGAAARANTINAANAANRALGAMGRKPGTYSPDAVVATGQRVILSPGIALSFVLNAIPVVHEARPSSARAPSPNPAAAGQSVPTQATWFYCYNTVPMPPNSAGKQFVSRVFQSEGDLNSISLAWDISIGKKYAPVNQRDLMDPNNFHPPHCTQGSQITLQQMHDQALKGGVTAVDWKYVPGQEFQQVQMPKPVASAQNVPPQAQKGQGTWWYCDCTASTPKRVDYMSTLFRTDGGLDQASSLESKVNAAWITYMGKYLANNHVPQSVIVGLTSHCSMEVNDQRHLQTVRDYIKAATASREIDVFDINWKYVAGQDTPVPRAPSCPGCRTTPP